jgi:hypothetical protein
MGRSHKKARPSAGGIAGWGGGRKVRLAGRGHGKSGDRGPEDLSLNGVADMDESDFSGIVEGLNQAAARALENA